MRIRFKPVVAVLCLAGLIAAPAFAETGSDNAKIEKLESMVNSLQEQVNTLKQEKREHQGVETTSGKPSKFMKRVQARRGKKAGAHSAGTEVNTEPSHLLNREELIQLIKEQKEFMPFDMDVPGQAFVSTGPYVGIPIQFSGSNLIVNSPSVNTDVQLLGIRKKISDQLHAMGGEIFEEPYHSHLLLSGVVEAQANATRYGGAPSSSDIDLTNVSLDAFFIGPSNWTLGFIEFMFDGAKPFNNYQREANSRVFVNKAFITIGNFSKSPFYTTLGQFYVPFGTYSSIMVTDTVTKLLGRTKARSVLVGYQQQGNNALYASTYVFRGDSHVGSVGRINNGGVNLGLKFERGCISGNVGGGVIANIADSVGMQVGTGFGEYERINHRVPAYNLRGIVSFGSHIDVIAEYIGASNKFNVNDMSFNNHGARPWAYDTEASYSFMVLDAPTSLGIGYARTNQALAIGLPFDRYSFVINTSIWRNTAQALEFRHDRNYSSSSTANGPVGAETVPGQCVAASCTATGRNDNAVTAQFDYYF